MRLIPLALGIVAVVLGVAARLASAPTAITWDGRDFHLYTHREAEAQCFDIVDDHSVTAFSLCGSLDTLCDEPEAYVFDANGDGERDVVVTTCSGAHVVTFRDGEIAQQRVEALRPGWWGRQVLDGGFELLVVGALLVLAGLVALVVAAAVDQPGSVK